jgi:hypothetical protein
VNNINQRKLTKYLIIAVSAVLLMGLGVFSGTVPKYFKYKTAKSDFVYLSTSYDKLQKNYTALQADYKTLTSDYADLKESASSLLVLAKIAYDDEKWDDVTRLCDELSAKFPTAEENKQASVMKKNALVMIRRAEEEKEKHKYETGISYKNIAFESDKYIGQKVHFRGRVLQAMESGNDGWLRLAVNNDKNGVLLAHYNKVLAPDRIYADEYVTLYGEANGLFTYTSTGGEQITIPKMEVERIGEGK